MTPSGVVQPEDFVIPLGVEVGYPVVRVSVGGARWTSAVVEFSSLSLVDFSRSEEPSAEFFEALSRYLEHVAEWILPRTTVIHGLVSGGLDVRLSIVVEMDCNQFEITLPPRLALAAGQASLPVQVHSY